MATIKVQKIEAKSILQKSGLPDVDWVVNPYTGCHFGCKYCYAAFVGRFRHPNEEWGSYVDIKTNAPELLKKELSNKMDKAGKKDIGTIFFSSVTDPYQGLEAKHQITRQCLQVLVDLDYQGRVSILTKSGLVTRDIDIFKKIKNLEVGVTVTSTGDPISRYLETYATPNEKRIEALKKLNKEGITTYAFVGPLLPHLVWQEKQLEKLLKQLKEVNVSYIYLEHLNLSNQIKERLFKFLKKDHPELLEKFQESTKPEYRQKLDLLIGKLINQTGLKVAHQKAIYHNDKKQND